MKTSAGSILFVAAAVAACSVLASALALAQGVKIGVLADQSGTYADFDGKWWSKPRRWRSRTSAAAYLARRSS